MNPYYAVNFAPGLFGDHEPSVTEEQWIEANRKLLAAVGDERYLRLLLDALKGVDPVTQHEAELADIIEIYERESGRGSAGLPLSGLSSAWGRSTLPGPPGLFDRGGCVGAGKAQRCSSG